MIRLVVAYDGTDFHGWQSQPGFRTVQGVVEDSIRRVVRHPVALIGCGRTDSGVHGAAHVSSFATTSAMRPDQLQHSIGSRLSTDLAIVAVEEAHPSFDARRCALSKLYRYRIYNARHRPVESHVQRRTCHCWRHLDVKAMEAGARFFVGDMDFSAMAARGKPRESMVRSVLRCAVERHYEEIRIDVEGTGFLYKQVRNMVGTLVEVGRGRWPPEHVADILAGRDRSQAGQTAPARGLCLQWVRYPPSVLTATGLTARSPNDPSTEPGIDEDGLDAGDEVRRDRGIA